MEGRSDEVLMYTALAGRGKKRFIKVCIDKVLIRNRTEEEPSGT